MRVLYRVIAPHFVAGFEIGIVTGNVERYAPILRRHVAGQAAPRALARILMQGWHIQQLSSRND